MPVEKMSAKYGMAITVVKDDRTIYEGCFGPADAENNIPVTPETDFYIASSTKSFTALATLILANQGKIDLNRAPASYFSEIDFAPELKADSVTIYHLLTHTAGLRNDPLVFTTAYTGNHTPEKLLRILAGFTRVDARHPFHQFAYTNFGYVVISMILERELKRPWQDILAETVFKPVGMKQTSAYISDAERYSWPLALPYTQVNEENRLERIPLVKKDNTMHAAGGMITTSEDLSRWLIVQLNQGRIDDQQVFPADLISRAQVARVRQEKLFQYAPLRLRLRLESRHNDHR
jgi:CubicO group peptidase (beta-lactamase class C family)